MRYVCLSICLAASALAQPKKPPATGASFEASTKPAPVLSIPAGATEAVKLSASWTDGDNHPAVGPDGRVVYAFGSGLPTVVCAPLRVCVIELQQGEKIAGEPHLGDSVRWNISPAVYGSGSSETNIIVLKPQESGLDTDLLIPTDRRAYYIRLVSKDKDYIARTAFRYSEDDNADKWKKRITEQREEERLADRKVAELQSRPTLQSAIVTAEALNFNYTSSGPESIRPVRVYDDSSKTYIRMPVTMRNREAPILLVVGADGKGETVNYRVNDLTYIVDRLFDRATLQLGVGKKAEKVEIRRDPKERT